MASQQSVLLNAIRRLILINDEDDRKDEQVKLERQLKETDLELQEQVTENFDKLRSVLETFNSVDEKVRVSQVKVATLRNNLRDCKILLRCKRDDLQRLWKEQMEQRKIIELLEEVERMKAVPDKLDALCKSKHFKTAAETLVQSIDILESKLDGVEALKDLRNDIAARKETLKSQLIDELHGCIYFKAPQTFKEDDITPKLDKFGGTLPISMSPFRPQSIKKHERSRSQTAVALEHQISLAAFTPKPAEEESVDVTEDVSNLNPEEDLPHYMAVLVEALYTLDAIPNALEALKCRMLGEMKLIIQRSSTEVRERAEMSGELSLDQNQPNLLKMLLDTAFKKYKSVARAHQIVLRRLYILQRKKNLDNLYLYNIVIVWNDIQRVIMRMLQDYLDTSTGRDTFSPAADLESHDINSFFSTKKKNTLQHRQSLFRLYHSSHSISIMSYMRESKGVMPSLLEGMVDDSTMGHQPTFLQEHLCSPQFRNITVVYQPLEKICKHIELEGMRIETKQEKSNELGEFLSSFVEDEFLTKIQDEIMKKVDSLTSESQRGVKDEQSGGMHKERRSNKPLLKSCVGIEQALSELRFLITDLPKYSQNLLRIGHAALETYAKAAQLFFHDLTHVTGDGANGDTPPVSFSHTWAVNNEEMRNHILRLPMWYSLHTGNSHPSGDKTTLEQESWILLDQIGTLEIKKTSIITSVANVRNLGLLHESMEWFSLKIKNLLTDITQIQPYTSPEIAKLHEVNTSISKLADHILLTLHLEVRMHCMHYLPPAVMRAGTTNEEEAAIEDVGIKEFNRDLCSLEEQLALQLSDMKLRFLFEGIGHLMATVLINTGKKLQRVGSSCITRMSVIVFLLQQNLTNITMSREAELDHARQFYELMRSTPQALLTFATEKEYNFTNAEYEQALAMICKSPDYKGEFEAVHEKLREHFDANREDNA